MFFFKSLLCLDMPNYFNNMPRKNANENEVNPNVVHRLDYPNRKLKHSSQAYRQPSNRTKKKNLFFFLRVIKLFSPTKK